ncbi:hypothetical protein B0H67DRAFT_2593 [Lasiosphaeris hirsuta]|uniref:2EXR domain-containing protein n=1 Tax=Lasiosphaeris hirsuta TaxID=260670 RepID=A0AA40B8G2_9PEZI|nr:hypothetical protein B0H67DRAFT_2593 [Lasiosphaeris hirsuta]
MRRSGRIQARQSATTNENGDQSRVLTSPHLRREAPRLPPAAPVAAPSTARRRPERQNSAPSISISIAEVSSQSRKRQRPKQRSVRARTKATKIQAFEVFPQLPAELRLMIWESAAASHPTSPEVCVAWPFFLRHDDPLQPLFVDTDWPPLLHACAEARIAALKSGYFRLRFSTSAGLHVPFRAFNPAIDTLYWGQHQHAIYSKLAEARNSRLAASLRHIAIPSSAFCSGGSRDALARLIQDYSPRLRTLTIVFAHSSPTADNWIREGFMPPARRCRLREIPSAVQDTMTVRGSTYYNGSHNPECRTGLRFYLTRQVYDLNNGGLARVGLTPLRGGPGYAWDLVTATFKGLDVKAATFVEYTMARRGKKAEWVEVCRDRKLGRNSELMSPHYVHSSSVGWDAETLRVIELDNVLPPRLD